MKDYMHSQNKPNMTKKSDPSGDGSILGLNNSISYTPEVHFWLNSPKVRRKHRKIFVKKLNNLFEDIQRSGRPQRGRAKSIRSVEELVYTLRLENNQGIRILFDYNIKNKGIEILVLAVSSKKDFQDKLKRSSEHIVHASSFDRLGWEGDDSEEIDLGSCTDDELSRFKDKSRRNFTNLSEMERENGWSQILYKSRGKRATIYDFRFPNVVDFSTLSEEYLLQPILKLQEEQKALMNYTENQFLLEGVAGTGKTTILIYRFVNDIKNRMKMGHKIEGEILFVTHNKKLKADIERSMKSFFPKNELQSVLRCIKTVEDIFQDLQNYESYQEKKKLTRNRFKRLFPNDLMDVDLFWEEYRGVLRGYNLTGDERILPFDTYEDIGRRRGRIPQNQRKEFYEYASSQLEKRLHEGIEYSPLNGGWDSLDLCRDAFSELGKGTWERAIQCLYIDEVQDLTRAELQVLFSMLNPDGMKRIAVAGDLSQSIQPSSFTWQALSTLIFELLDIRVSKHATLTENYRSTPYLVNAANYILKLQGELDNEGTPVIQRPFAGENTGEPGLVFFGDEEELIQELERRELPNAACPMLVRDKATKERLKSKITNHAFIEPIANFKGLEKHNVLLWQPEGGSECVLDLRSDPVRGEQQRKNEFSESTALLELRHVFVAFTRSRHLMGIMAPKNERAYFLEKAIRENESIIRADIEKIELFAGELSQEELHEYAREFLEAGRFQMAAESFRNIKDEYNYHYCMGRHCIELQEYDKALDHLAKAKSIGGEHNSAIGKLIGEYATTCLDQTTTEKRPRIIALILHSADGLTVMTRSRLEGEKAEERANWQLAAKKYIESKNFEKAKKCIHLVRDLQQQVVLFLKANDSKQAQNSLKKFVQKSLPPKFAVSVALGEKAALEKLFNKSLKPLKPLFVDGDVTWARRIASGNVELDLKIKTHQRNRILLRSHINPTQEKEALDIFVQDRRIKELRRSVSKKQWKFIQPRAEFEAHMLESNYTGAIRHIWKLEDVDEREELSKRIMRGRDQRNGHLTLLNMMIDERIVLDVKEEYSHDTNQLQIMSLVANAATSNTVQLQKLVKDLHGLFGTKNNQLVRFASLWSQTLQFYLHDVAGNAINPLFEFTSLVAWEARRQKINPENMFPLLSIYAICEEINQDLLAKMQVNEMWAVMKPKQRESAMLGLHLYDPTLNSKLYIFRKLLPRMEANLNIISGDNLPPEVIANNDALRQGIVESVEHFQSSETMITPPQKKAYYWSKDKPMMRQILSHPKVAYLFYHHLKSESADNEKTISTQETIELEVEPPIIEELLVENDINEDKSDADSAIEHSISTGKIPIPQEKAPEPVAELQIDLGGFDSVDLEATKIITTETWTKIKEAQPQDHIELSKQAICNYPSEEPLEKRRHLLVILDETLNNQEMLDSPQIKFAMILALMDQANAIEGITNVIPESDLIQIQMFKNKFKPEILRSNTFYSQRVFN